MIIINIMPSNIYAVGASITDSDGSYLKPTIEELNHLGLDDESKAYTFCTCGGTMYLRCNYLKRGVAGFCYATDTHNGGCTRRYYKSYAVYICSSCGRVTNSGYSHYCYITHSSCGLGTVVSCDFSFSGL